MIQLEARLFAELIGKMWPYRGASDVMDLWMKTRFPESTGQGLPLVLDLGDLSNLCLFLGRLDRLTEICSGGATTRVEKVKEASTEQSKEGNWNHSPYMCGVANGLKLAVATLSDTDPKYFSAPPKWLSSGSVEPLMPIEGMVIRFEKIDPLVDKNNNVRIVAETR